MKKIVPSFCDTETQVVLGSGQAVRLREGAGLFCPTMNKAKTAAAARRGSKATKSVANPVSPADLRKLGGVLIQTAGILEKMAGIISRAGGAK